MGRGAAHRLPVVLISVLVTAAAVAGAVFLMRRAAHALLGLHVRPRHSRPHLHPHCHHTSTGQAKSFVPFCDAVRAAVPAGEPYYAYQAG